MALGSINKTVFKGSPILDFTSSYNFVYKMFNTRLAIWYQSVSKWFLHIKGNTKNAYPFTKVFLTLSYYDHLVEMIFIWQLAIFRYLIIKALPILYEMHASLFSHSYHIKCRRNLIFTPRIKWFHSDAKIRSILRFIYSHKEYISITKWI